MDRTYLQIAKEEATRFLERVQQLQLDLVGDEPRSNYISGRGRLTGAVRRSSLDLTRALANLRQR